jgi:predicted DCC family thiol-disulfide oxidoreductase YuxK
MKYLDTKLIIYDSNCKVCSSFRDLLIRLTPIPASKVAAYKDLPENLAAQVDPNKFRNAMALIDTAGSKTLYGTDGVAYIFSSQYRFAGILFRSAAFKRFFTFLYRILTHNRYIIALPKSQFHCDCFPDRVVKFRVSYIAITLMISIILTGMFGMSLNGFFPRLFSFEAAGQILLIAGTGWVIQMGLAGFMMRDKALDYIGHLGSIMVVGLLILVPWMLFYAITGISNPYIPALSVLLSSAYMLYLHVHRVRYLELSQTWTITWFLLLQATASFWIYFFHVK